MSNISSRLLDQVRRPPISISSGYKHFTKERKLNKKRSTSVGTKQGTGTVRRCVLTPRSIEKSSSRHLECPFSPKMSPDPPHSMPQAKLISYSHSNP